MTLCWATCPRRSSPSCTHTCSPALWTIGTRLGGPGAGDGDGLSGVRSRPQPEYHPQATLPPSACPHHRRDLHSLQQHHHGHLHLPAQVCRPPRTGPSHPRRAEAACRCVSSGAPGLNVHPGDSLILRNVDCFRLSRGQLEPPDETLVSICAL